MANVFEHAPAQRAERAAVSEAFGEFLSSGTASASQIEFVRMIVEHLTDQGVMDEGLLYAAPFIERRPGRSQCSGRSARSASLPNPRL